MRTGNPVTFVCPVCGKEKLMFPEEAKRRKFCSKSCANKQKIPVDAEGHRVFKNPDYDKSLNWKRGDDQKWMCPYQVFVSCSVRRCSECGWHPDVKARRDKEIREKYGNQML